MNSNDSGSHKNVPRPAPLNSPQTVRVFLSRAVVVANVVCASSPRPPTALLASAPPTPPPAPLDASWRSLLKALQSPLCTQISFQVCLPSSPPPPLRRDLISFGQTVGTCLGLFLPVHCLFCPPRILDQTNDAHASGPCVTNTSVFLSLLFI